MNEFSMKTNNFASALRGRFDLMAGVAHSRGRVLEVLRGIGGLDELIGDQRQVVVDKADAAENERIDALKSRVILAIGSSDEGYPLPPGSFDTILDLGPRSHGTNDVANILHLFGGLNPGGKLLYRSRLDDSLDLQELEFRLKPLGGGVSHAQACDVFDDNLWLKHQLGDAYDHALAELAETFELPETIELWEFVERSFFPLLPLSGSRYGFFIIERGKEDHPPSSWANQPRLKEPLVQVDAIAFKSVMGNDSEAIFQTLNRLARGPGGLRLLVTLDQMISKHLSTRIDFLSLLNTDIRGRILDLMAWRWTQAWYSQISPALPSMLGLDVSPLLDYEVFQALASTLKPLKDDDR